MPLYVEGSLFESPAQTLVNTVNTVGVMGKGVALQFKKLYPDMFKSYQQLCRAGAFRPGSLWLFRSQNKWVLNFATKEHWRLPSRLEYIETGLRSFVAEYASLGITSIAFPPLGCGNGQLDYAVQVRPLMERYLADVSIDVFIYPDLTGRNFKPEHRDVKAMARWLRAEPAALPFHEVWRDLVNLLGHQSEFLTSSAGTPFEVHVDHLARAVSITKTTDARQIAYDELEEFWQQLRAYGFATRRTAPGRLMRPASYLIPLFGALDYVRTVRVTDDFAKYGRQDEVALQLLPSAKSQPEQQAMFKLA